MKRLLAVFWCLGLLLGCGDDEPPPGPDADSDTDTDTGTGVDRCCELDPGSDEWTRETVALAREVEGESRLGGISVALDDDDVLHSGWGDGSIEDGQILDALDEGGGYRVDVVEEVSLWFDNTSIAARGGVVAIAYTANVPRADEAIVDVYAHHATRTGDGWSVDTVEDTGAPHGCALALDAAGSSHLSFFHGAGEASYGTNAGGAWLLDSVGPANARDGQRTAIALGPDEAPHVFFRGPSDGTDLLHAVLDADWTAEVVDAVGSAGGNPAVAGEADGSLHVVYRVSDGPIGQSEVRYASSTGGAWNVESLETAREIGTRVAIAVEPGGPVHVTYDTPNGVRYATNASGAWEFGTVATVAGDGAVAVDETGVVSVVYHDRCRGELRRALRAEPDSPECAD